MTDQWPILSIITFLPLFGAFIILLIGDRYIICSIAFITTVLVFILSIFIYAQFKSDIIGFQLQEQVSWLGNGIEYHMGIDGISILFIILAAFLMPFCILASWEAVKERFKECMIAFLILETMIIGVFCALDAMLFYIFFEGSLIPMFVIIGVWGGTRRIYASFKFFLYTLFGSILMLVAIMSLYWQVGTLDIPKLIAYDFPDTMQMWLWLAFFASFAVKMPMWPVHTWLPDAHVEAPTAGSVILAGILLKLGGYGFLRFSLSLFPQASEYFSSLIFILSVIAILYASLIALVQSDIKKLIAYSSVAHMGYVTMGIFAANIQGIEGAIFQMLSHGIVSAALFLCVGVIYNRIHTREIVDCGGLVSVMPKYAVIFLLFSMANIGLPGTSGFIGEFLSFVGIFQVDPWITLFAVLGIILSAAYTLYLYSRIIFGEIKKDNLKVLFDLSIIEKIILYPMIFCTLFFGVYPTPILSTIHQAVKNLVDHYSEGILTQFSMQFMQ